MNSAKLPITRYPGPAPIPVDEELAVNPITEYALITTLIVGGLAALFFLILWDDRAHAVRRPHRRHTLSTAPVIVHELSTRTVAEPAQV